MRRSKVTLSIVLCIGCILALSSCKEDEGDTVTEVKVLTAQGVAVPGATVRISCESSLGIPCEVQYVGLTDGTGLYRRRHTLPKVMRIDAFRVLYDTQIVGTLPDTTQVITQDSLFGNSYISIIEHKTTRQTVVIR